MTTPVALKEIQSALRRGWMTFVAVPLAVAAVAGVGMASVWLIIQMLGYAAQPVPARALLSGREARLAEVPVVLGPALPQLLRVLCSCWGCGRL